MLSVNIFNIAKAQPMRFTSDGKQITSVALVDKDGRQMATLFFDGWESDQVADAINAAVAMERADV
jgi:hypothetical protein